MNFLDNFICIIKKFPLLFIGFDFDVLVSRAVTRICVHVAVSPNASNVRLSVFSWAFGIAVRLFIHAAALCFPEFTRARKSGCVEHACVVALGEGSVLSFDRGGALKRACPIPDSVMYDTYRW